MPTLFSYANPFDRNHCVVHAWTHLSDGDTEAALDLARRARTESQLTRAGYVVDIRYEWWLRAVGLELVRFEIVRSRPTLTTFVREHPRGRFYVRVRGHAVAVIDGHIYGGWRPRSRVLEYLEVSTLDNGRTAY